MLGKVIKNEFKDTGKMLLPLNLILIGVTILGMIVLRMDIYQNTTMIIATMCMGFLYIVGLLAIVVINFVYLAMRFYKSMYGAEGYLTHTLPVSGFTILNSKLLVAVLWTTLSMTLIVISVFSLVFSVVQGAVPGVDMHEVFRGFEEAMEYSRWQLLGMWILYSLISGLCSMLMIFAALSIGQLFNKYKVGAAIVTYVIFYIINQIISLLVMIGIGSRAETTLVMTEETAKLSVVLPNMLPNIIQALALAVIYYIITAFICNKKLNLD